MPLFKLLPHDRKKRVLVNASNLTEVIDAGKEKLKLTDGEFKVVLEEDGAEIQDDDILLAAAEMTKAPIALMVLSIEDSWPSTPSSSTQANLLAQDRRDDTLREPENAQQKDDAEEMFKGLNLWDRFPKRLLKCCQSGTPAIPSDRRDMIATIASYLLHEAKDSSRKSAERIASLITEKYPKTFQDTIGGQVLGAGMESLRTQIYNAVNYRKEVKVNKTADSIDSDDENQNDHLVECLVPRKYDEYGCIEYQPLLPATESKASQEEKRLILEQHHSAKRNDDEVMALMDVTYPTQRIAINSKHRDTAELLRRWPYLTEARFFFAHASRLLGKSVKEEWDNYLSQEGQAIAKYFKVSFNRQQRKRGSNKTPKQLEKIANDGLDLLKEAKKASTTDASEIPMTAVIFPLLANHFGDDRSLLYEVIEDELNDDELKERVSAYPTFTIKGRSLYDSRAQYFVIIEKVGIINVPTLLNGFLALFLSYYVFGYVYPEKVCRTLEFLQRVILKINPKSGHKKAGKKRKSVSYDPKVFRLANEIEEFHKSIQ